MLSIVCVVVKTFYLTCCALDIQHQLDLTAIDERRDVNQFNMSPTINKTDRYLSKQEFISSNNRRASILRSSSRSCSILSRSLLCLSRSSRILSRSASRRSSSRRCFSILLMLTQRTELFQRSAWKIACGKPLEMPQGVAMGTSLSFSAKEESHTPLPSLHEMC